VGSGGPWLSTPTSFFHATAVSTVRVCTHLPSFAPTLNVFRVLAVGHLHPPSSVVICAHPHLCLHLHASTHSRPSPTCIQDDGGVGGSRSLFVSVTPPWFLVLVCACSVLCLFALIPTTQSCLFNLRTCSRLFAPICARSFVFVCPFVLIPTTRPHPMIGPPFSLHLHSFWLIPAA
jgi:hypothetical protein